MTAIQFGLVRREWRTGDSYLAPIVTATLEGLDENFSALIDTGAAVSVVDIALLRALNYSEEEIRAGERVELGGLKDRPEPEAQPKEKPGAEEKPERLSGWLHDLTIVLGDGPRLTLRDVQCVVCDGTADTILLGQQQALEALVFLQNGLSEQGELRGQ